MLRITDIELREIRLPLREPFRISSGVVTERRILLTRVTDVDGPSVWAECVAGEHPNYSPETIDTAWLALREWFAPRLLAADVETASEVDALLAHGVRGHRMARAPLEMAVWALEAERLGVSLAQRINGTRSHVETGISLGIQPSPAALVDRAREALDAGYRKIKLKIAPGADIEYVAAVRASLGEAAPLMVDANNAYALADIATLSRLDEFGLIMIEQPLDHEDIVRHAELQRVLRTPICLDESITSPDRAEDMITLGSGRIVNIKPGRVGGFTASIAIHDLCARHDVPVWCGGMLESGVGRAYNVALASLPNFSIPGDISPSARYWTRDIVTPEWTMRDGRIEVPSTPGLGVSVDVNRIDDLTVRTESLLAR
jgi:o-succinylbenzoate synthase